MEHDRLFRRETSSDTTTLADISIRNRLREHSPSVKLVAFALACEGPLTAQGIAEETLLPERTIRYALNRMKDHDLVTSRFLTTDARKCCYYLVRDE